MSTTSLPPIATAAPQGSFSPTSPATEVAEAPRSDRLSVSPTVPATAEKKRILVVDDRTSDSKLMKQYLEGTNEYTVLEVNVATAALSAAEEFLPHLILLDVMMPGMSGGELASKFRASPKLKAVPIVFITALVTKEEVGLSGGSVGGYPFLSKPVVLKEAVTCIKFHLGG